MTSVPRTLPTPTPRRRMVAAATGLVAVSTIGLLAGSTGTAQAASAVPLGAAQSFAVLAGAGITNTGATTVSGDIGSFATTSIDGGITLSAGADHGGDADTQAAKTALSGALVAAAGAGPRTPVAGGTLGGLLLQAGVYNSGSSLGLTGVLTLDGGGSYDSVFVFQAGSDLTTASSSTVVLTNGAQACNVFWQVGSSATLGSDSRLVGTVLADQAITLGTRADVEGRVLASVAAVSLDANTITRPDSCRTGSVVPVVTPLPSTTPPISTPTPATPAPATPTPSATAGPSATPSPSGSTPTGAPTGTPGGTPRRTDASAGAAPTGPVTGAGTSSGRPATATRRPGTPDGGATTYGQVGRVPVGSVDTGDGSTS